MEANITRRGLIGTGAAAATVLAAAAVPALADELAQGYDYTADVVILGAGGAGLMAAVGAHESGASTIVLEKASFAGGDTLLSNQAVTVMWPDHQQRDAGASDTWDSFIADQKNSHWASRKGARGEELPEEFPYTQSVMERFPKAGQWIEDVAGVNWVPRMTLGNSFPFPLWDTFIPRIWAADTPIVPAVEAVVLGYDDAQVLYSTEAVSLIRDGEGRVAGVSAIGADGRPIAVGAGKAVVIATGSFNANSGLIGTYLGNDFRTHTTGGSSLNTGDGLRMAMEAGAATVDLDLGSHFFPTIMGSFNVRALMGQMGSWNASETALGPIDPAIYINMEGRRYAREAIGYSLIGLVTIGQPMGVGWYVIDSTMPNATILDADGYWVQGDTVEELAERMNVDAETLAAELERYNGFVRSGVDEDFGKPMEGMREIAEPPFYAFMVNPQHYATYGGVKVDLDGRVLDEAGEAIPGLYAAGIVTGSFAEQEGLYYSGGVPQALACGMMVGENAAAE